MVNMASLAKEHQREIMGDVFGRPIYPKEKCEYHLHDKTTLKCVEGVSDDGGIDEDGSEV